MFRGCRVHGDFGLHGHGHFNACGVVTAHSKVGERKVARMAIRRRELKGIRPPQVLLDDILQMRDFFAEQFYLSLHGLSRRFDPLPDFLAVVDDRR